MKKLATLLLASTLLLALSGCSRVNVSGTSATLTFTPYEYNIIVKLTEEEAAELVRIFDGKQTPFDPTVPACGFSEEVSLQIGTQRFWIACDDCPIVFHQNTLRYFSVSEEEKEYIHQLFEQYGGKFPCI